jgi:hypothetical protein
VEVVDFRQIQEEALHYLAALLAVPTSDITESLDLLMSHGIDDQVAYVKFFIPKKSGGKREIRAPVEPLKSLMRLVYKEILARFPLNYHIHGFRPRRSSVTNARFHLEAGAAHMINMDIANCFPSTRLCLIQEAYERTMGMNLRAEGLSPRVVDEIITVLSRLSTLRYGRSEGEVLPMGSPSSPALLNLVLQPFDLRLAHQLRKIGERNHTEMFYTRYGDDMSISSPQPLPRAIFGLVPSLLSDYGYKVKKEKTVIMHRGKSGRPLEVTGLILGDGHLVLPDRVVKAYAGIMYRVLSQAIRFHQMGVEPPKNLRQIIRGIFGICKMVYDGELPQRLLTTIEKVLADSKAAYADEAIARLCLGDDLILEMSDGGNGNGHNDRWLDYQSSQALADYHSLEEQVEKQVAELEGALDPTGYTDPFRRHGGSNS